MTFRRFRGSKRPNRYLALPIGKTLSSVPQQILEELGSPQDKSGEIVPWPTGRTFEPEFSEALQTRGWFVYENQVTIEENIFHGEIPR